MTCADLKLYLLTIPLFFALDLVWLGEVAKSFYQNRLFRFLLLVLNLSMSGLVYAQNP